MHFLRHKILSVSFWAAPCAVALTTYFLLTFQHFISLMPDHRKPVFISGYYLIVALMSMWGGRAMGFWTLLLSEAFAIYFLTTPGHTLRVTHPADAVTLGMLAGIGTLLIFGADAWRRNRILLRESRAAEARVQELLKQSETRAAREHLLNELSVILRDISEPDAIQERTVSVLGRALNVDRCYFALYDVTLDAAVIRRDFHRSDLPSLDGTYPLADRQEMLEELMRAKEIQVVSDTRTSGLNVVGKSMEKRGLRSFVRVPFFVDGRLVAALAVGMADGPRDWTSDEVALVEAVARQTHSAVDSAQARQREQKIASLLQDALLPTVPDCAPGLLLDKFYKAALEESRIGGDFYDVFALGESRTALVVGDLSGKGLAAAAQVAVVRNMLRYALYREGRVADAVTRLNATVTVHELLAGFATLFVGVYDGARQTLTYVSCGQEPGLIRRKATGDVEELGPTGPVLGAADDAVFEEESVHLAPGDALALLTDGLTEAGPNRVDFLGVPGLRALLGGCDPDARAESIVDRLVEGANSHAGGDLRDDACLLVAVADAPQFHYADARAAEAAVAGCQ